LTGFVDASERDENLATYFSPSAEFFLGLLEGKKFHFYEADFNA
jgi:hypothetical protein